MNTTTITNQQSSSRLLPRGYCRSQPAVGVREPHHPSPGSSDTSDHAETLEPAWAGPLVISNFSCRSS